MNSLVIILILIPAFMSLMTLLLSGKHSFLPAIAGSFASLLLSLIILIDVLNSGTIRLEFPIIPGLPVILEADQLTAVILTVVTSVALFIFIFSIAYMKNEPGKKTFWSGMNVFLAAMLILVLASDWFSFIIGWEVMGFASYRLISVWHHEKKAREGATRAFMTTRITDMGLYIAAFLVILQTESSQMQAVFTNNMSFFAAFALLFTVMGKSAQVPFQSWLSGAMAGPTPVSSFLHSATMVAAGVLLLIRVYPGMPLEILPWIGAVGGLTVLMTGLTAIFSKDLKQMLAASTSSHLGFMLLALGAGYPGAAIAHLLAHAYMKSSLFLGAGIWQQVYKGTEFEKLESAGKKLTPVYLLFAVSAISLAGIPPLIGYYSKDAILAAGLKSEQGFWYFLAATTGTLLTALYMGRALYLLRSGNQQVRKPGNLLLMKAGMILLVLFVISGGFLLETVLKLTEFVLPHSSVAKITGIILAVTGLIIGWFLLRKEYRGRLAEFIRNNYHIQGKYDQILSLPVLRLSAFFYKIDKSIYAFIEKTGMSFYSTSKKLYHIDTTLGIFIDKVASFNLRLASLTRLSGEKGLENAIQRISTSIKRLGDQGQKLQNGMIHRELLWTTAGLIGFVIILLVINL